MKYKHQQAIEKRKVMGSYPYKWIKHFYSKGGGYGSEPRDFEGNSIVDETLVEVKGSELQQFLDEQLTKKEEEVRERLYMATIDALDEWWNPPYEIERIMDYIIKYSRNPKPKNEKEENTYSRR